MARVASESEPSATQRFAFTRLPALAAAESTDPARADELSARVLQHLHSLADAGALTRRQRVQLEHDPDLSSLRAHPELTTLLSTGG